MIISFDEQGTKVKGQDAIEYLIKERKKKKKISVSNKTV